MDRKIYPTPLIDERGDDIGIESMQITYTQPCDSNQDYDDEEPFQKLTISTECGAVRSVELDEGKADDGFYLVIKTDRWAVDSDDEIGALIADFRSRIKGDFKPKKEG